MDWYLCHNGQGILSSSGVSRGAHFKAELGRVDNSIDEDYLSYRDVALESIGISSCPEKVLNARREKLHVHVLSRRSRLF